MFFITCKKDSLIDSDEYLGDFEEYIELESHSSNYIYDSRICNRTTRK